MILTITPNPAWDVTISAPRVAWGESTRTDSAVTSAGGKGVNVARVLAQLGYAVTALVPVPPDEAGRFRDDLDGVESELVPVARPVRRSFTVVETETSAATVLNERGGPLQEAEWQSLVDRVAERLADATCVVVSGSLPSGAGAEHIERIVRLAADHRTPLIADLSGDALLAAARAGAGTLKPNRRELREATGQTDPVAGARALQSAGAGTVIVSLGEEGMILVPRERSLIRARLPESLRGNPTGAGDAAVAAVASCHVDAALDEALDAASVLRRAVAWSAAAVLEPAAGSVNPAWRELLARVEVKLVDSEV